MNNEQQEVAEFLQLYMGGSWQLIKLYEEVFREYLDVYSLTKNEKDVLLFLHNNPLLDTATDIVKFRSISKSLVCKSVDSLVAREYLEQRPDKIDRRIIHLKLSHQVANITQKLHNAQNTFFTILSKDISSSEYKQFSQLIKKMINNAEQHTSL